jgi:hypothetical protein
LPILRLSENKEQKIWPRPKLTSLLNMKDGTRSLSNLMLFSLNLLVNRKLLMR